MRTLPKILLCLLLAIALLAPAAGAQGKDTGSHESPRPSQSKPADEISGMYTFLQDGEFVQISVEEKGKLTGFISRFGDLESDRGAFLDQFFKDGALDGNRLSFTTELLHGTWYEFQGTVSRGDGRTRNDQGYYVVKGILTQHRSDAGGQNSSARARDVTFKSFPQDVSSSKPERN
jgi:hypothetical protein